MIKRYLSLVLPVAALLLSAAVFTKGQEKAPAKQNPRGERADAVAPAESPTDSTRFRYEFSNPEFVVRHIVIEHDSSGRGKFRFERRDGVQPIVEPFEFSSTANARVAELWKALNYLESTTDYQSQRQFPHLGTIKIGIERGSEKRAAEFNWTSDANMTALVAEYRRAVDQAMFVFDINIARENLPLEAPKLLSRLETLISRNGLSDPTQLIRLLKELNTDERIPLMARNQAGRLLKKVEKR